MIHPLFTRIDFFKFIEGELKIFEGFLELHLHWCWTSFLLSAFVNLLLVSLGLGDLWRIEERVKKLSHIFVRHDDVDDELSEMKLKLQVSSELFQLTTLSHTVLRILL